MRKFLLGFLVLCVFVILLISGCAQRTIPIDEADKDAEPAKVVEPAIVAEPAKVEEPVKTQDKELLIAAREVAASLDPVQRLTYLIRFGAAETLFRANAEGIIEPFLAKGAEQIDSTTWKINLREGARFWSGKPVNADAVIASLERSRELDVRALPFLEGFSFSRLDEYTVQVKTEQEHMTVPLNLSHFHLVIHNAEATFENIDTIDFTGMYRIVEFIPRQRMILEINENYWGERPIIRRVIHEEIADPSTRALAILSGRYHMALNLPVVTRELFVNREDIVIHAIPPANTQTIYLNLRQPQFQDFRVRQALSWALDREELVILGAEGQSSPVTTWLGSNPAFKEAKNAVYYKHDMQKASELLDEAGWILGDDGIRTKDGKPLTLRLMTWGGDKALGEALQHQWTMLGVKAEVQHGDYSLIQTARETGDWDAFIEAWGTFGNVTALLKGQFSPDGAANYGGFDDEETNNLLAQLAAASSESESRELALKVNYRVAQQAPVIALHPRQELTAVSTLLDGFTPHFRQFENLMNANLSFSTAD